MVGNPYFMGPYKPLRDWVEFRLSPMEMSWELIDPGLRKDLVKVEKCLRCSFRGGQHWRFQDVKDGPDSTNKTRAN